MSSETSKNDLSMLRRNADFYFRAAGADEPGIHLLIGGLVEEAEEILAAGEIADGLTYPEPGGADLRDAVAGSGAVTALILTGKRNGILPFYSAALLAAIYGCEDSEVPGAAIVTEYVGVYGIREALRRFSGFELEPEMLQLVCERHAALKSGLQILPDKVKLMKKAYNEGFNAEQKYRGCAQCALFGLFEANGSADASVFKSASGMSGGMAMNGEGSCGGYTGGIMYLGLHRGRRLKEMQSDGDKKDQYLSYETADRLFRKFEETYGSVICKEIHRKIFGEAYCLLTKSVRDDFENAGAHRDKCTGVIGTAAAWVTEILYDYGELEQNS